MTLETSSVSTKIEDQNACVCMESSHDSAVFIPTQSRHDYTITHTRTSFFSGDCFSVSYQDSLSLSKYDSVSLHSEPQPLTCLLRLLEKGIKAMPLLSLSLIQIVSNQTSL